MSEFDSRYNFRDKEKQIWGQKKRICFISLVIPYIQDITIYLIKREEKKKKQPHQQWEKGTYVIKVNSNILEI